MTYRPQGSAVRAGHGADPKGAGGGFDRATLFLVFSAIVGILCCPSYLLPRKMWRMPSTLLGSRRLP